MEATKRAPTEERSRFTCATSLSTFEEQGGVLRLTHQGLYVWHTNAFEEQGGVTFDAANRGADGTDHYHRQTPVCIIKKWRLAHKFNSSNSKMAFGAQIHTIEKNDF